MTSVNIKNIRVLFDQRVPMLDGIVSGLSLAHNGYPIISIAAAMLIAASGWLSFLNPACVY